jgi:F0F1-type ATP synthase gamma subunit
MTKLLAINQRQSAIDSIKRVISAKKIIAASVWQRADKQTKHLKVCYAQMRDALEYKLSTTDPACIPQELLLKPDHKLPSVGIVFGVDDIMCGGLSIGITNLASNTRYDLLYVFGAKTAQALSSAVYCGPLSAEFDAFVDLATCLTNKLAAGKIGTIDALVLQHRNKPTWRGLLPLVEVPALIDVRDTEDSDLSEMPALLLALRLYWQASVTCAQENLERVLGAEQSVKNCDQLLTDLKALRNKVRQEAITQELNEIVSGFV